MARGSIGAWRRLRKRPLCMRRGLLAGEGGAGRMIGWEGFWLKLVGRNGHASWLGCEEAHCGDGDFVVKSRYLGI